MTVEVVSLGCRLNLAESDSLRALLASERDLVVVNSCAVTGEAVRQTRQAIRKARRSWPDARLLVTGCAAETEREAIAAMPEVDGLVPNASKLDPRAWNASPPSPVPLAGGVGGGCVSQKSSPKTLPPLAPPASGRGTVGYTRAFIPVQNGCDHACTFCVIPQGRGPSRSLAVAEVIQAIERHASAAEVVLTGVDLTSWGYDLPGGPRLGALVRAILDAFPDLARLRLSSLDGVEIDGELFELLAGEPRVMPHVHLSLQHGHDLILKRMKRRHSREQAVRLVEGFRARRPDVAVGADLIAGFPTEDDAMHAGNLSLVRELGIVHGHVFPYSLRPGTPAARMPQVLPAEVKARAAELRAQVAQVRHDWLGTLIGRPLHVLAEADGTGHAENFARVRLPAGTARGSLMTVVPTAVENGLLR